MTIPPVWAAMQRAAQITRASASRLLARARRPAPGFSNRARVALAAPGDVLAAQLTPGPLGSELSVLLLTAACCAPAAPLTLLPAAVVVCGSRPWRRRWAAEAAEHLRALESEINGRART